MTYSEIIRLMREIDELACSPLYDSIRNVDNRDKFFEGVKTLERLAKEFDMVERFLDSSGPIDDFINSIPVEEIQEIITTYGA